MFVQFYFPDLPWHFPYSQVTIFFYYFFPGAVPVTIFFYYFFYYLFPGTLQVTIFFTVFLLINYFMVSRGWLKSPFTTVHNCFSWHMYFHGVWVWVDALECNFPWTCINVVMDWQWYIKKFGYHLAPVVCCKCRDVLDPLNLDALPRTSTKELEFNVTCNLDKQSSLNVSCLVNSIPNKELL
jgi:hypothetical protein